jgi:hypothetical protein
MRNPFTIFRRGEKVAPKGFGRISELPISTAEQQFDLLVLDWRPLPFESDLRGCFFFWIEIEGQRTPYFLSEEEARHIEVGPHSIFTHLRVVKFKNRYYALPIYPNRLSAITVLPPPPKEFPARPSEGPQEKKGETPGGKGVAKDVGEDPRLF